MRVGIIVECTVCGRRKKPRGRSAPLAMANGLCDQDCNGYEKEPLVGTLWPGETEKEFGFPIDAHGTREEMHVFRRYYIRDNMMESIRDYIDHGVPPGRFLTAVICNKLQEAVGFADDENMANLPAFADFFHNEAPAECWGSEEKMRAWVEAHMEDNQ